MSDIVITLEEPFTIDITPELPLEVALEIPGTQGLPGPPGAGADLDGVALLAEENSFTEKQIIDVDVPVMAIGDITAETKLPVIWETGDYKLCVIKIDFDGFIVKAQTMLQAEYGAYGDATGRWIAAVPDYISDPSITHDGTARMSIMVLEDDTIFSFLQAPEDRTRLRYRSDDPEGPFDVATMGWVENLTASVLEVVSVKNFGAVGDGTTNENEAFEAAVAEAVSRGGGTVFVPQGTYLITSPIVIPSEITLMGAGMGATTIIKPDTVKTALTSSATTGQTSVEVASADGLAVGDAIHIYDDTAMGWDSTQGIITEINSSTITFTSLHPDESGLANNYNTTDNATLTTTFPMVFVLNADHVTISNMTIDQNRNANDPEGQIGSFDLVAFPTSTIHLENSHHTLVERVEMANASGDAYSDQGRADVYGDNHNILRDCWIHHAYRHGIHLGTYNVGAVIDSNTVEDNGGFGLFYCAWVRNSVASSNKMIGNLGGAFSGGDARDSGNIITNNIIDGLPEYTRAVEWANPTPEDPDPNFSLIIANNWIRASAAPASIYVFCPNTTITGNHLIGGGIQVSGSNMTITDNHIQGYAGADTLGILVESTDSQVTGNTFTNMVTAINIAGAHRSVFSNNTFTNINYIPIIISTYNGGTLNTDDLVIRDLHLDQSSLALYRVDGATTPRLLLNGVGDNGASNPSSAGPWNSVSGEKWNGTTVNWVDGSSRTFSIYIDGVGWIRSSATHHHDDLYAAIGHTHPTPPNNLWLHQIIPMLGWKSSSGTPLRSINSARWLGGYVDLPSTSTSGTWIEWDLPADAGIWDLTIFGDNLAINGTSTLSIDGVDRGTVNQYATPNSIGAIHLLSGLVIASNGNHVFRLTNTAPGIGSGTYGGRFSAFSWRRTA